MKWRTKLLWILWLLPRTHTHIRVYYYTFRRMVVRYMESSFVQYSVYFFVPCVHCIHSENEILCNSLFQFEWNWTTSKRKSQRLDISMVSFCGRYTNTVGAICILYKHSRCAEYLSKKRYLISEKSFFLKRS